MGLFDEVVDFITDEEKKPSTKVIIIGLVFLSAVLLNNITGFTFHYESDKRIDEIQKLNSIIKDSATDSSTKKYAIELRKSVVNRKDWLTQVFLSGSSLNNKNASVSNAAAMPKPIESPIRNNFLLHITSGGLYYLLGIIFLPMVLVTNKKASLYSRISTGTFAFAICWGLGFFFYSLFNLIPQLSNKTYVYNYLLNSVLQIGLLAIASLLANYATKKKKTASN